MMTTYRQNRAGNYLHDALLDFTDDTPQEKTIEILLKCSELADQDFADCLTSEHKQKVWATLISAVHTFIRSYDGKATACKTLLQSLTNAAQNRPGSEDLRSRIRPKTYPHNEEWSRSCVIALLDQHPTLRQQTLDDATKHLRLDETQILKLHENFKGKETSDNLKTLVKTAKGTIKEFGYKTLKELI